MAAVTAVNIYPTTNVTALANNVQSEVNRVVQQVNQNTGTFANDINLNQNRITNVANPADGGDAVNLNYMNNVLSTNSADMFKILNRRTPDAYLNAPGTTGAGGSTTYTIIFKAAEGQSGSPSLGMSFPGSPAPSGTVVQGGHVLWAAEVFSGGTFVYDRFPLPPNFTGLTSAVVYWVGIGGTAHPTWQLQLLDVGNGDAVDQAYTTAGSITGTAVSSNILVISTIGNGYSGLTAGDLCEFAFGRSDGGSDFAGLLEIQFNISHA